MLAHVRHSMNVSQILNIVITAHLETDGGHVDPRHVTMDDVCGFLIDV